MAIDTALTLLETVADVAADRPAVLHAGPRRSWAELDDRAARLAGYLAPHGVGRGSRVTIALRNGGTGPQPSGEAGLRWAREVAEKAWPGPRPHNPRKETA